MRVLGDGSVVQREKGKPRGKCRAWELSVAVDDGGRRRKRTRAFHGTWTEARAALSEFVAELADAAPPSGWTFREYSRRWHERRVASGAFAPSTMRAEGSRLRMMCRDIGDMPLSEMDAGAIRETMARWRRTFSESTLAIRHETLSSVFSQAAKDGFVASSPMADVPKPRPRVMRHVLSPEGIDRLSHALNPSDGRQLAVLLCLTCGLRKGEAIALRWSDWDGESVHIERADDGQGHDKPPKTPAGVRSVPAPSWLASVLDSMRGAPDEPMCQDAMGRRLGCNAAGAWWDAHRRDLGVSCTLHELRHSYLTQLARAGVHPRVMMQLAGHDSMKVCMEVYTHVSDEMQKDAVRRAFG